MAKKILIQGAMDIEIEYFLKNLCGTKHKCIAGYDFYEGTINQIDVVISKTLMGTINSATATTLGITTFNPNIVINQGIAGAHKLNLHTGDIIIGKKCSNINFFSTPCKYKSEGSNPFDWEPYSSVAHTCTANENLASAIESTLLHDCKASIYTGTLGSGDVFNKEFDRITWIENIFHTSCEDMESIGTYSVCNNFNIPCVGVRIISNNELLHENLDENTAIELQKLLINALQNI